jgi:hypothetical protein
MVDITLAGTDLEGKPFLAQKIDRGEHDWIHVSVDETSFRIRCGSTNLDEAIVLFCDWAAVV